MPVSSLTCFLTRYDVLKRLCFMAYAACAILSIRHAVSKIIRFRREYIRKRAMDSKALRVYVRMFVIEGGTAYLLSERRIFLSIIPKTSGDKVVVDESVRAHATNYVSSELAKIFATRFGNGVTRCYMVAHTRQCDDTTYMIAKQLKQMHRTREMLFASYQDLKSPVLTYIRWFEDETLVNLVKITDLENQA